MDHGVGIPKGVGLATNSPAASRGNRGTGLLCPKVDSQAGMIQRKRARQSPLHRTLRVDGEDKCIDMDRSFRFC